jgi:tight adherence protein C
MPRALAGLVAHPACTMVRRVVAAPLRRRQARRHDDAVLTELPIAVDLVGVAVGAGCSTFQAVAVAARWSPPRLARVLGEVGRATAIGASFDDALVTAGTDAPNVRRLTETLRTSSRLGSPAASALARLAQEVRADVRRRAEARARTVPVRLLFPLVFCVLPAFALLTVVPVLLDGIAF